MIRHRWYCAILVAVGACRSDYAVVSGPRDWTSHPAIVELDAPSMIYAVSDVHGGYDRLVALLANANLTAKIPSSPELIEWTGGDAALVVAGDLFDKGPQGIEVVDALVALDASAKLTGGRVIVTLGNHEAEFLQDPTNSKADSNDGLDAELHARGIDPVRLASGADPRGVWIRNLPFGARIGSWFFSHAGNTKQRTVVDLERAIRADVEAHGYSGAEVVGADSILESRDWFDGGSTVGARSARAVGAAHVVFGHSPHALGADGDIALAQDGALFRIDCGMSPAIDYSKGALLRVRRIGAQDVADSISATGATRELWRGP